MNNKLLEPKVMEESHLLNSIKLNTDEMSSSLKELWIKRKLQCKMELMKRWIKELHANGYKASIISGDSTSSNSDYKTESKIPSVISIDDLLNELDLFSN